MKKILAIAVVLSALGAGVMFADDSNPCINATTTAGGVIGFVSGGPVGGQTGAIIGLAVGTAVCPSSSSSGSTTDDYRGFEPAAGWDD